MLNRREQVLLIGVLAIAGGYALLWLARSIVLRPLEGQRARIQNLSSDIAAKNVQVQQALTARTHLAAWEQMSLLPDERAAQSLYQEFLFKLTQECHLQEGVLTAGRTQRGNHFTRIPFTVSGKITIENLAELLYRFYQPKLLHQVRSASIHRAKGSDGNLLEIQLSLEGLSLHSADPRSQLLSEGQESGGPSLAGKAREEFAVIAQKNILTPFREPNQEPPPAVANEPQIDAARFIFFVASTRVGDDLEAWLYNRLTNAKMTLQPGDELEVTGKKGKMTDVNPSRLVLDFEGKEFTLELGKNLRDMQAGPTSKLTGTDARTLENDDGDLAEAANPSPPALAADSGTHDSDTGDPPTDPTSSDE